MIPHLTARGRWTLGALSACLLGAAFTSNAELLLLAQAQAALLAIGYARAIPLAGALDRRQLAVFAVDQQGATPRRATVGRPIEVALRAENRSPIWLRGLSVSAHKTAGLAVEGGPETFDLGPGSCLAFDLEMTPRRTGRQASQGLDLRARASLGLFEVSDYAPCPIVVDAAPSARGARSGRPAPGDPSGARGPRPGAERGEGGEFRELRAYQSGDPLRRIAWKASARRGRLIARQYERESQSALYVALDISASMRGGGAEGAKFERALSIAAARLERAAARGDRFGLLTFDEALYGHVPLGRGPLHLRRAIGHLIGVAGIVDEERTDPEADVPAILADYLLMQERLDFRYSPKTAGYGEVRVDLLRAWASARLRSEYEGRPDPLEEGVLGASVEPIRELARRRGVPLPYRIEGKLGAKERGLSQALEAAVRAGRAPSAIAIVTDLCSLTNIEVARGWVRAAHEQGHEVEMIVPFTPAFYDDLARPDEKYAVLRGLFARAEGDERARYADEFRALGVEVSFVS